MRPAIATALGCRPPVLTLCLRIFDLCVFVTAILARGSF
jgi:hypothetical protein